MTDQTSFERRLLDDLESFRRTLPPASPPSGRPRRITPITALAAAVVVAGAAAVLGIVVFKGGGQPAAKASVAEVKQRTLAAVSSSDLILHTVQTSTGKQWSTSTGVTVTHNRQEVWQDLSNIRMRMVTYAPDGHVRSEFVTEHSGTKLRLDMVQYDMGTWTTATGSTQFAWDPGGSQAYAQRIADELANGTYTLVGTDTIDGRKLLQIRRSLPKPDFSRFPRPLPKSVHLNANFPTELDMWIDPSTYLPAQEEARNADGVVSHSDMEWLPRTPENLAKLDLVVPTGFTHQTTTMNQGSSSSGGGTFSSGYVVVPHK